MNLVCIETEDEFAQFVNKSPTNATFRGQRNASWKLESSLERAAKETFGDLFRHYQPGFEIAIIDRFIERCVRLELGEIYCPKNPNNPPNGLPHCSDTFQWLSLLQHYGHPTRLIDFTDDLWVAFYFALAHSEPNVPFAIYSLQMTAGDRYVSNKSPKNANGKPYEINWNGKPEVNINELLGLVIKFSHFSSCCNTTSLAPEWHNPKQNYGWDTPAIQEPNPRIKRQHGRFLYQVWLDGRIEEVPELTKYEIVAKLRPTAIKMLQAKGTKYTREFLFPTFEQRLVFNSLQ